ncbi:MAG: type II secretion system protein [Lachnospiraceae bacterium]|nr:type II secretion system protein [Lachnospiraceae bacterium]
MKKIQKSDNKGFTLVELIVVIVILAILAAILVPALLGYIDKAKQQQVVLNAKSALTAAQAEMSSLYAKGKAPSAVEEAGYSKDILDTADVKPITLKIGCSVASAKKDGKDVFTDDHKAYTITYVEYKESGMTKSLYYDGSSWDEVAPSEPAAVYVIDLSSISSGN